ncbi:hypothetical protein HDV04_000462 [Boothiomyces sp. JEL0838]|nr:hypothetical protein HDV04_000462 [Boothiomyces sp. JEL0838]
MCINFGVGHCRNAADCGGSGFQCVNSACQLAGSSGGNSGPSNSNSGGNNSGSPPPSGGNSGSSPPPTSGGSSSNNNSGTKGTTSSNNSGGSNNGNSNSNSGSNSSGNSNSNSKGTSTATNSISSPNPTNTQNSAPAVSGNPSSTNNDNTEDPLNNQGANDNSGNSNGVSINDFQKALIVTLICAAIVAFLVVYLFVNYQDKIKDKIFGKKKSDIDSAPGSPIPISSQSSQSTPVVTASNINGSSNGPGVDAYNQRQAPDTQPRFQYSPSVGSSIPLYTNSTNISFTGNQTSSIHLQPNGTLPSRNSWNGSQVSQHLSPMLHSNQPVQTPPIQYGELPIMLNNRSSQAVESIPPTLIVPPTSKNNTAQI